MVLITGNAVEANGFGPQNDAVRVGVEIDAALTELVHELPEGVAGVLLGLVGEDQIPQHVSRHAPATFGGQMEQ
jgi:hypothetical protein